MMFPAAGSKRKLTTAPVVDDEVAAEANPEALETGVPEWEDVVETTTTTSTTTTSTTTTAAAADVGGDDSAAATALPAAVAYTDADYYNTAAEYQLQQTHFGQSDTHEQAASNKKMKKVGGGDGSMPRGFEDAAAMMMDVNQQDLFKLTPAEQAQRDFEAELQRDAMNLKAKGGAGTRGGDGKDGVEAKFWDAATSSMQSTASATSQHKGKHQINSLAQSSAALELQVAKNRAMHNQSKAKAASQYGWR
jgi:hypothetical protein